ncbi:hypothetical protein OK016_21165 [Vibrio chagasii]|nr:hypothetical protein [Vibrio chagasii]
MDISTNAMMNSGARSDRAWGVRRGCMWKKYTYGAILVLHAGSTFPLAGYMDRSITRCSFASWPMLAACVALFLLRDYDTYSVAN